MEVGYTDKALEDIMFWKKSGNKVIQQKISSLIISIERSPFNGIGNPEPLNIILQVYGL